MIRSPKHLRFIRSMPCCVCGDNTSTEAAHLRSGNLEYSKLPTGGQQKPGDNWVTPLCGRHHRQQHTMNEMRFWKGIFDPHKLAAALWINTGDYVACLNLIAVQRKCLGEEQP